MFLMVVSPLEKDDIPASITNHAKGFISEITASYTPCG